MGSEETAVLRVHNPAGNELRLPESFATAFQNAALLC